MHPLAREIVKTLDPKKPQTPEHVLAFALRIRTSADQEEVCLHLTAAALRLRRKGAERLAAEAMIIAIAGAKKSPFAPTPKKEKQSMPAPRMGGVSIRRSPCR